MLSCARRSSSSDHLEYWWLSLTPENLPREMNRQAWSSSMEDWKISRTTTAYLQWKIMDTIFPKVKKHCSLLYILVIFRAMRSQYAAGSWHLLLAALCQDLWQSSLGFCFGTGSIMFVMCFWNCRIDSSQEGNIAKCKGVVELIWISRIILHAFLWTTKESGWMQ